MVFFFTGGKFGFKHYANLLAKTNLCSIKGVL